MEYKYDLGIYQYCDGTYYRALDEYGEVKLLVNISEWTDTPYVIASGVGSIHTRWHDMEYYRTFEEAAIAWLLKCRVLEEHRGKFSKRRKIADYI